MRQPGQVSGGIEPDPHEFRAQLWSGPDAAACIALFSTAMTHWGFDVFACGEVDLSDRRRTVIFAQQWPEPWRKHYLAARFHEYDPVVSALARRRGHFTWDDLRRDGTISEAGREALALIGRHGWTKGFAAALHRGGMRFGLVSLAGRGEDPPAGAQARLAMLCEMFLTRIKALELHAQASAFPAGLTVRELACVRLVANGCTDAEVAGALGISKSTAHQHVEAARRRFGAKSRTHLVAIVVSLGIVGGA